MPGRVARTACLDPIGDRERLLEPESTDAARAPPRSHTSRAGRANRPAHPRPHHRHPAQHPRRAPRARSRRLRRPLNHIKPLVTTRLDRQTFSLPFFPGRDRHDSQVVKAYRAYRNSFDAESRNRTAETEAPQVWGRARSRSRTSHLRRRSGLAVVSRPRFAHRKRLALLSMSMSVGRGDPHNRWTKRRGQVSHREARVSRANVEALAACESIPSSRYAPSAPSSSKHRPRSRSSALGRTSSIRA
jgi:hypothetical protein